MKNIFLLIVFLCAIAQLHAQIEQDKVLHFGAGALSGAAGAFIASEISDGNRGWTYVGAIGTSFLVGLTKEALDKKNGNEWDNGDLAATVLGGVTVGVTIDLFSGKKRRKRKQISVVWY
jgi:uncharacterized protein YfiM (DUF2279 family)